MLAEISFCKKCNRDTAHNDAGNPGVITCGVCGTDPTEMPELEPPPSVTKSCGPRPLYYVRHPDGSFTEADPQPFGRSSLGRAEASTAGPSTPDAISSAGTPTDRRST